MEPVLYNTLSIGSRSCSCLWAGPGAGGVLQVARAGVRGDIVTL